ncbi:MAG: orotidine-5'-phosphate decarboxylase [Armatimonadota bacterium]|nr:orotidine-5'-phosphate decarboxylase [Armatimonadota bacterium]
MTAKNKIILALDVSSQYEAVDLVRELNNYVGAFKVGLELFNSVGPKIFDALRNAGAERIFYDCKFHDIPNTVAGAARAAVRMGIWMFNVHASGGSAMMRAAVEAAGDEAHRQGIETPLVIGVTVLTSISEKVLHEELSVPMLLENHVTHLAILAQNAGLAGVVASPHEIIPVKAACGPEFIVVTPGVRPQWAATNDQARIMTPREALNNGADYLVIGRAVTAVKNRVEAAERILEEISQQ